MVEKKGAERRRSERYAMDFRVRIHEIREGRQAFLEDATLHDVSGVGIGFVSCMPEAYRPGQRLHISILLPGTDRLEARLEGNATVVRIGRATETGTFVGVSMDDPLEFISGVQQSATGRDTGHGT